MHCFEFDCCSCVLSLVYPICFPLVLYSMSSSCARSFFFFLLGFHCFSSVLLLLSLSFLLPLFFFFYLALGLGLEIFVITAGLALSPCLRLLLFFLHLPFAWDEVVSYFHFFLASIASLFLFSSCFEVCFFRC